MTLQLLPTSPILYDVHDSEHPTGTTRISLTDFESRYGASLLDGTQDARDVLLAAIDNHHVHGRGGAHFPSAIKIRSALASGEGGTVIANAAEGEPSAAKDAALWQTNPHLVLRGLWAVADLIRAKDVGIWVHDDSFATRASIDDALAERAQEGTEQALPLKVYLSPHRYVSGEASAIINAVQGGPAVPKFFPSKARAWGDGNLPVLVFNTETLAHIGLLASANESATYADQTLITVLQPGRRLVQEVGPETQFASLLHQPRPPQAVLLGGYGGQWAQWDAVAELSLNETTVREHGLSLGAGIIAPLPADVCGVKETARVTEWMASQSARQCGPCIYGLEWLAEDMNILAEGGKSVKAALKRMRDRLPQLVKRGACTHPDGVARMVTTALDVFENEIALHKNKQCSAQYTRPFFPTTTEVHA